MKKLLLKLLGLRMNRTTYRVVTINGSITEITVIEETITKEKHEDDNNRH